MSIQPFKLQHFRGPKYKDSSRWNRVLQSTIFGLKKIETRYYSFSSDDDFIFPRFIVEGINFLEENLDFVAFTGPEWKISQSNQRIIVKSKTWNSCEYDDPVDRLVDYLVRPSLAYYGVVRTKSIKHLNLKSKSNIKFSRTGQAIRFFDEEIPWVACIHISGKIHYQERFYQGIRGDFEALDRIEVMAKKIDSDNPYVLGAMSDFLESNSINFLNETVEDFIALIKKMKTKYDQGIVELVVKLFVWNILAKHKGVDLRLLPIEYNLISKKVTFRMRLKKKSKRYVREKIAKSDELNSYIRHMVEGHF
jgi:hypothetical protein